MRWLIVAIFLFGLLASFAAYDAGNVYTGGQRTVFGITAIAAMVAVVVMAATLV